MAFSTRVNIGIKGRSITSSESRESSLRRSSLKRSNSSTRVDWMLSISRLRSSIELSEDREPPQVK